MTSTVTRSATGDDLDGLLVFAAERRRLYDRCGLSPASEWWVGPTDL